MTQEVLKLALEALENNKQTHYYCEDTWYSCPKHEEGCANDSVGDECNCGADEANAEIDKVITAIKEALAQEQEPVAWKHPDKNMVFWEDTKEVDEYHGFKPTIPLYPYPQRTWVGLTDEERSYYLQSASNVGWWQAAQFIEAKLKEKNT